MRRSILFSTTRTPANRATRKLQFVRLFRLNRWLTFLIVVPVIVAITLLALFFFAAFLGLFAAVLAVAALRVWWLRREMHPHGGAKRLTTTDQAPHAKPKF